MDSLTEQLEELFDDAGEPTYEVDLHVRCGHLSSPLPPHISLERSADSHPGLARNICDQ